MTKYRTRAARHTYPPDVMDFLHRRTIPFLDGVGIGRPLNVLLMEAYLQGMRDAVEVIARTDCAPDHGT